MIAIASSHKEGSCNSIANKAGAFKKYGNNPKASEYVTLSSLQVDANFVINSTVTLVTGSLLYPVTENPYILCSDNRSETLLNKLLIVKREVWESLSEYFLESLNRLGSVKLLMEDSAVECFDFLLLADAFEVSNLLRGLSPLLDFQATDCLLDLSEFRLLRGEENKDELKSLDSEEEVEGSDPDPEED